MKINVNIVNYNKYLMNRFKFLYNKTDPYIKAIGLGIETKKSLVLNTV